MFATIASRYPAEDGDPAASLDATLRDQLEAGLGMVGDGRTWSIETDADVLAPASAWSVAAARVAALADAAGIPAPPLKACLAGPLSSPGPLDGAVERTRAAIEALTAAGAPVVQLDEPWLASPGAASDAGRRRAARAWRRTLEGAGGHIALGIPGGGAAAMGEEVLTAAPFASYLVDLVAGPGDWRVVARLPGERGVVLGVADPRSPRPTARELVIWAARYAASMRGRGTARVGVAPGAGLETLSREAARARLGILAEAARLAALPPDELAKHVDPRAIDARSGALGRWVPRSGPRR